MAGVAVEAEAAPDIFQHWRGECGEGPGGGRQTCKGGRHLPALEHGSFIGLQHS